MIQQSASLKKSSSSSSRRVVARELEFDSFPDARRSAGARVMAGTNAAGGVPERSRELLAAEHAAPPSPLLVNAPKRSPGDPPATKPDFSAMPPPPTALLGKLSAFLPQMKAANDSLAEAMKTRPASEFDVECVDEEGGESHVAMDVGLGVVELNTEDAVAKATANAGFAVVENDDGGRAKVVDDDDDDDDEILIGAGAKRGRDGAAKKTPGIEVLN